MAAMKHFALALVMGCLLAASTVSAVDCPSGLSTECDDGNACTDDVCNGANVCEYTTTVCNDNIDCTQDSCEVASGCVFTAFNSLCNDNDACTSDICRVNSGGCVNLPNPIEWCDDLIDCTDDECLPASGCINRQNDDNCEDNNDCTSNKCTLGVGCVFDTIDCNDDDECTVDSCVAGVGCVNSAVSCDDGISCTIDSCDSAAGCINVADHSACADNNDCSVDTCSLTQGCQHIDNGTCDDGNPCTTDSCNLVNGGGCVSTPNNLATCSDGDACTTNDRCFSGSCIGTEITCNDNNECTADSCDSLLGCRFQNHPSGTACFIGGSMCDGAGTCIGCSSGADCDDGDACTMNLCTNNACDFSTPAWAAGEWTSWTHCDATCGTGATKRYRAALAGDTSCFNQEETNTCNTQACNGGECQRRSLRYRTGTDQLVSTTCPSESSNGTPYDAQWCALNVAYMENGIPYWPINNENDGIGFGHTQSCIL